MSENNVKNTLSHFNTILCDKVNSNTTKNMIDKNKDHKGLDIIDISDNFLAEYNSAKMLQYSHLYFLRLNLVKEKLVKLSKQKWKNAIICKNILETRKDVECVIIGNIYKDMPLKPQYLKGVESILGAKKIENFVNDVEDFIVIEDETGRIRITNVGVSKIFWPSNFVTGIACALYGKLNEKGLFIPTDIEYNQIDYDSPRMKEIVFANNKHKTKSLKSFINNAKGEIIILISGLNFGLEENDGKLLMARKFFLNFIQGNLSNVATELLDSKSKKLFILGNLIYPPEDAELVEKGSYLKQNINNRVYKKILQNYDEADIFLNNLSHAIPTYLMPGESDISSSYFPQPKLCEFLFLHSKKTIERTLHLKSNPFYFELDELSFLFTSGQNIDNIRKFSFINENENFDKKSSIKLMEKTLDWGHLCPSAPDTLRTWPIQSEDPIMLNSIPNVYVIGNQKYFEQSFYKYKNDENKVVKLIAVPRFSETFSFILLDSQSLNTFEFNFSFTNFS